MRTLSLLFRGCSLRLIMGELKSMIVEVVKERELIYVEYNVERSMLQSTITRHPINIVIHIPVFQVKFDDDTYHQHQHPHKTDKYR